MPDVFTAAVAAFGVVFVAELGDKTQLLALNYGSRHPLHQVVAGLAVGYGLASLLAVAVGGVLGASLPQRPIEIVGGLVFVVMGIQSLRPGGEADDEDDGVGRALVRSSVVATVGLTILLAEMGDKTQIVTATLAARSDPVGTWLGATMGEVASGTVGVVAGSLVGGRIPESTMRWMSGVLFVGFGIAMLAGWP